MNKLSSLLIAAILIVTTVGTTIASPAKNVAQTATIKSLEAEGAAALTKVEWAIFSENLVDALGSDHDGLQQAAMRLVIRHGDNVQVERAVFDVMRIYRNADSENLRRMAVVTLSNMNSKWAIDFLRRSERFEKSDIVRQTIRAVVSSASVA